MRMHDDDVIWIGRLVFARAQRVEASLKDGWIFAAEAAAAAQVLSFPWRLLQYSTC